MPIATVSDDVERFELSSLEGAWVTLKRLSHGQNIKKLEMSTRQAMKTGKGRKDSEMAIEMAQRAASFYEFKNCIVDHNLEKMVRNQPEPVRLNFNNEKDFDALDPRVGTEIDKLIEKLNTFEEDEDDQLGN